MAQTSRMQTYQDAIEAMLYQSVIMPPELLNEVERFIQTYKGRGYTTKEEFIRQAVRFMLKWESGDYEYVEIPKEEYEKLNRAVKEMNTPYTDAEDFIQHQIQKALEKYEEWLKERGEKE
jgi:metal-responsive CopG/Arc/MetJ family transcriptional regulator